MNFVPLGGASWALWLYPLYFFVSFFISASVFRANRWVYVVIFIGFVILFIFWFYALQGHLFDNWRPFGVDAY
ncbi:MAG: hypothetical protein WC817_00680 [Patescibacteria group bacterium]